MERDTGIEPVTKPWQGFEIPLHQSRGILGAPWQNRTAVTWLQNRCNTIILIGQIGCGWQIRTADAPSLWDWSGDHPTRYKFIVTYFIYVGNWWSLKESNHPPTTPQLKATDLQSAERNRLQNTTESFFCSGIWTHKRLLRRQIDNHCHAINFCWNDSKTGTL